MVDFVSEVQEELRKDDYNKWLKQYGPYLFGVIVAVILATAYLEWNKSREDSAARATSAAYLDAANKAADGEVDKAVQQFTALAEQAPSGYAGLSLMRAAGLELEKGNAQAAIALFDQSAEKFELNRHKHLAQIKAAYILADQGRYEEVKTRVRPLAEKDEPYEFLARELLGFAALQTEETQLAHQQFSYLETIPGVPETIQGRAKQYLSMMSTSEANVVMPDTEASSDDSTPTDTPAVDDTTPAQDIPAQDIPAEDINETENEN